MADEQQLRTLREGFARWNEYRANMQSSREALAQRWAYKAPKVVPDLSGADLQEARLPAVDLSEANLQSADLGNANLEMADLRGAKLVGANLVGANLAAVDLTGADLTAANLATATLSGANLRSAIIRKASLYACNLIDANLREAEIVETDLESAVLVRASVEGTIFRDCFVYGISAWDLKGTPKAQEGLQATPRNEPPLIVDKLVVAQFMYLLLEGDTLRDTLNCITKKGVLLLGRFADGGHQILNSISAQLRDRGYAPFIFDFDRPRDRNYTETVQTLVGLSRFVIVDVSGPSVPQELYATVPHFKVPFIPILEHQRSAYSMLTDLLEYDWVFKPVIRFGRSDDLGETLLPQIVAAAEQLSDKRDQIRRALFETLG